MTIDVRDMKRRTALEFYEHEPTFKVVFDVQTPGVLVPPNWMAANPPVIHFDLGEGLARPIKDLVIDEEGLSGTFSFGRSTFFCRVPWDAVLPIRLPPKATTACGAGFYSTGRAVDRAIRQVSEAGRERADGYGFASRPGLGRDRERDRGLPRPWREREKGLLLHGDSGGMGFVSLDPPSVTPPALRAEQSTPLNVGRTEWQSSPSTSCGMAVLPIRFAQTASTGSRGGCSNGWPPRCLGSRLSVASPLSPQCGAL